jgi:hypothetical protein
MRSGQIVRLELTSRDLKDRESDEPLTECAPVPASGRDSVSSIRICKPKKSIGVDMKSPNSHGHQIRLNLR